MQFTTNYTTGVKIQTVKFFPNGIKTKGNTSLFNTFMRIGGEPTEEPFVWKFSNQITPRIINEIIHNTCFICGGLMVDSQGIKNMDLTEITNESIKTIWKDGGNPIMLKVRKCISCGHSHT